MRRSRWWRDPEAGGDETNIAWSPQPRAVQAMAVFLLVWVGLAVAGLGWAVVTAVRAAEW